MSNFENIYKIIKKKINRSFFVEVASDEVTTKEIENLEDDLQSSEYRVNFNLIQNITTESKTTVSDQIVETIKKTEMAIEEDKINIVLINGNVFYKNHSNFNKLLKFIEEPPKSLVIFIFCTKKTLPKTITSRLIKVPQKTNPILEDKLNKESSAQILNLFKNDDMSLKELSDTLKGFNITQIESFLSKLLSDSLFRRLNYKQLDYILKILKETKEFASLNIPPLGNYLSTLKKVEKLSRMANK